MAYIRLWKIPYIKLTESNYLRGLTAGPVLASHKSLQLDLVATCRLDRHQKGDKREHNPKKASKKIVAEKLGVKFGRSNLRKLHFVSMNLGADSPGHRWNW